MSYWFLLLVGLAVVPSSATIVRQLSKPMQLAAEDILKENESTNSTLSPPAEVKAVVRHMGDPHTTELAEEVAHLVTWNVSTRTGVEPKGWEQGVGQRGCYNTVGANAFQANGDEFASWVNTSSWTHTSPVRGGGPQAQVYTWFSESVRPWGRQDPSTGAWATDYSTRLAVEVSAKLPVMEGELAAPNVSGAVAQLGIEFYVVDSGGSAPHKSLAYGGAIYDSRPFGDGCGNEFVASDTFTPFVSSPILHGTKYTTAAPGSSLYANVDGWSEWRWFKFTVNASQLELAVKDINRKFPGTNISESAKDYTVASALYGNEVTGYFQHPLRYASSVRGFSAYVER